MRVAHLIMAHKNPTQLARLIKKLEHPEADFFIHIDKKVDITAFLELGDNNHVKFINKRTLVNWGGYSTTNAILTSVKEILDLDKNYDFINLLSGQDYPIRSTQKIHDHLAKNIGKNFISYDEGSIWWTGAKKRYRKYHFTDFKFIGKHVIEKIMNWFTPNRIFPLKMKLYGGEKGTWWTITSDCASYLCEVVHKDEKLKRFLRMCWGSDEFLASTLIMNSAFKHNTINNNFRYIFFPQNEARPRNLITEDFENLISSDMLFARKFDIDVESTILNRIDIHTIND